MLLFQQLEAKDNKHFKETHLKPHTVYSLIVLFCISSMQLVHDNHFGCAGNC